MSGLRLVAALVREAWAAGRSQPVASVLTAVMVAGLAAAVLLTTGQTAAAERAALAAIDATGTRSIIVRAPEDAGLTADVLERIAVLSGVESATAFGPVVDARNARVPGAPWTGLRTVHGVFLVPATTPGHAYVSASAADALGLADGTGAVRTADGHDVTVYGIVTVPEHLAFLEPLAVHGPPSPRVGGHPADAAAHAVTTLVVLADEPRTVDALSAAVVGLLGVDSTDRITVETSAQLAALRAAVGGQLGEHGRVTVLGILAVAGVLVAANLLGLVQLRRKDFGRRRALGASQRLIIGLLLVQTAIQAVAGAAIGTGLSVALMAWRGHPLPGGDFVAAVAIAGVCTALLAAVVPACVAARREPLYELRIA